MCVCECVRVCMCASCIIYKATSSPCATPKAEEPITAKPGSPHSRTEANL